MGIFDRFLGRVPVPPRRVLATLQREDGRPTLRLGHEVLSVAGLPAERLAWLARLSAPLLVEADVVTVGDERRVTALGAVRPHPRVAALRAVGDLRYAVALEELAVLGDGVEADLELLAARIRAYAGLGRMPEAEADVDRLCTHPATTAAAVSSACEALPRDLPVSCRGRAGARNASLAADDATASLRLLLLRVPMGDWLLGALLRAIDEALTAQPVDRCSLDDAPRWVETEPPLTRASRRPRSASGVRPTVSRSGRRSRQRRSSPRARTSTKSRRSSVCSSRHTSGARGRHTTKARRSASASSRPTGTSSPAW
jgi:hypothetical protein